MAAQAKGMSAQGLDQLATRIQRRSGRSRDACWRLIVQYGIKGRGDYRRWTDAELEIVREELVKRSIDEVARKINRTPKAIRNILRRNRISVRDIRCDLLSVESLATALHVRRSEVLFWIQQRWLKATVTRSGKQCSYSVTPEALKDLHRNHYKDLLRRGIYNQALFEAYIEFCFAPKHTFGEQLLDLRGGKRDPGVDKQGPGGMEGEASESEADWQQ